MFQKTISLDVDDKDLALIESALHTQYKILRVQADAGAADARAKLNDIKGVLAVIESQRPVKRKRCRSRLTLPFLRWITS